MNIDEKEGNIIWLASYPKSGNTWLRIFLNNLLSEQDEPVDINALYETGTIASARNIFDEFTGIDSAHLTLNEIDYYLPRVHLLRSRQLVEKEFVKIHNAFTKNIAGEWIIPLKATYRVIYLIRNPLDVCVSFAYHSGHNDFDKTIQQMANSNMMLAKSKRWQNNQLHQYMGSWSDHVNSWIKNLPKEKILIIRYEDMKLHTLSTFVKIVHFAKLKYTIAEIKDAIEKSKIKRLQAIEEENGFKEKIYSCSRFFRKGVIDSWREELSERQVNLVIQHHKALMEKFDYLDFLK